MRISDWSADVCSSDLEAKHVHRYASGGVGAATGGIALCLRHPPRLASATGASAMRVDEENKPCPKWTNLVPAIARDPCLRCLGPDWRQTRANKIGRRHVGTECVRTWKSRMQPDHKTKQLN